MKDLEISACIHICFFFLLCEGIFVEMIRWGISEALWVRRRTVCLQATLDQAKNPVSHFYPFRAMKYKKSLWKKLTLSSHPFSVFLLWMLPLCSSKALKSFPVILVETKKSHFTSFSKKLLPPFLLLSFAVTEIWFWFSVMVMIKIEFILLLHRLPDMSESSRRFKCRCLRSYFRFVKQKINSI